MRTIKQILKEYNQSDRITREHMWIRFAGLRGQFDDMERCNQPDMPRIDVFKQQIDGFRMALQGSSKLKKMREQAMDPEKFRATRTKTMDTSAIREILKVVSQPGMISLAGGIPAPESFPMEIMGEITTAVLRKYGPRAFQYDATEGFWPLREALAEYLKQKKIDTSSDELVITSGSQGVLDAVGKVFIGKGDRIAVEAPTYLGAIQAFKAYEPVFATVETDEEGLIPHSLESVLRKDFVKLVYLVPTFQNPTGRTISLDRRKQIADIIRQHDVVVLEDDPYSDLRYRGTDIPPIKALAPERVIYVGTLSKVFSPGLRVGYCVAPAWIRKWIVVAKQGTDLHTSTFSQALAAEYITGGYMEEHVPRINSLYRPKQQAMADALDKYFTGDFKWTLPDGGMFLWAEGPPGLDTEKVFVKSVQENVAFVPGRFFYTDENRGMETMRLNFTMTDENTIDLAIKRLAKVVRTEM